MAFVCSELYVWFFSARIHGEASLQDIIHWKIGFSLIIALTWFTGATLKEWVAMATALKDRRENPPTT